MTIITPNQRSERRFWAAVRLAVVWPIALGAVAFAKASWAEDARKGAVPDKQVQAKLQLQSLPWGFGAGFPWLLPDTTPCRTATHISGKSAASFH